MQGDLEQLAQEWQAIPDDNARNVFYDEHVFPTLKQVVLDREIKNNPDPYTYLILPVGFSPEPLILSILTLRPERVYFLYTRDSEIYLDRIVKETNLLISKVKSDLIDETNVPDIYRKVRDIYEEWGKPSRIAVDISGGKKSMVGGCALAGAMIGARLFYIDSQFLAKMRKPWPGSEKLTLLENPYDVFGDLEFRRAQSLYIELDFIGASELFRSLQKKTSQPELYEARGLLCQAYAFWDDWQLADAVKYMQMCIQSIENYRRLNPHTPLSGQLKYLKSQSDVLQRLAEAMNFDVDKPDEEIRLLSTPKFYQPLIGSLKAGALRQEKRGKRDVAALMWYRLIELLSQRRLCGQGLSSGKPDYAKLEISKDELLEKFRNVHAKNDKKGKTDVVGELPKEISLLNGYAFLLALQDDFTREVHLGNIRSKINARNKGIFAHGFKPLSQEDYVEFKTLAVNLLEFFGKIEHDNQLDWELCQFIDSL